MTTVTVEAYRFFRSMGDRASIAYSHAQSEAEAKRLGFEYAWEDEQEPWYGEEPLPSNCDLLWCGVTYKGEPMASLGMIAVRFRDPYIRYVEAELAGETLDELEERAAKDPCNLLAAGW